MAGNCAATLRFGISNCVPGSGLSSNPVPVTALNNLKYENRSKFTIWDEPATGPVVNMVFSEPCAIEFVALPNSTLTGNDSVRWEFFADAALTEKLYDSEFRKLAEPIPMGQFRWGVDPWGVPVELDKPDVYLLWLPRLLLCRAIRLTVDLHDRASLPDVGMRMILAGESLRVQNNFAYGASMAYLTPPTLVRTASGSSIPSRRQRRRRRFSLSLPMASDIDRDNIRRMEMGLEGQPFLISAYPERTGFQFRDYTFLARLESELIYTQKHENIHEISNFNVIEV